MSVGLVRCGEPCKKVLGECDEKRYILGGLLRPCV